MLMLECKRLELKFVYISLPPQAMLLFCGAAGFQSELAATFHSLVEDPHALVRRTIACGFHEVKKKSDFFGS